MLWTLLTGSPSFPGLEELPGVEEETGVLYNNKGCPQVAAARVNGHPFPL